MKSSELARMAGVSVRTLRHYHAIGLLPEPERAANGYREYEAGHLLRLLRIRQLATLGFSLEQIGPMIDELDAERQEVEGRDVGEGGRGEGLEAGTDRLLDDLDRQLEEQIEHLNHQRELIRHIRTGQADPDYPERAAAVLEAIDSFERQTAEYGFLLCALTEDDKMAMGIAAHLYSDAELAEIERIFRAIPERGLTEEYLRVSHLMDTLPDDAGTEEREEALEAGWRFSIRFRTAWSRRTGYGPTRTTSACSTTWPWSTTTTRRSPFPTSCSCASPSASPNARRRATRECAILHPFPTPLAQGRMTSGKSRS